MGVSVDTALVDALLKTAPKPEKAEPAKDAAAVIPLRKASRTVSDWANVARNEARSAQTLEALAEAIRAFDGSPLKATCEQAVG